METTDEISQFTEIGSLDMGGYGQLNREDNNGNTVFFDRDTYNKDNIITALNDVLFSGQQQQQQQLNANVESTQCMGCLQIHASKRMTKPIHLYKIKNKEYKTPIHLYKIKNKEYKTSKPYYTIDVRNLTLLTANIDDDTERKKILKDKENIDLEQLVAINVVEYEKLPVLQFEIDKVYIRQDVIKQGGKKVYNKPTGGQNKNKVTLKELRLKAAQLNIIGRSKLNKAELELAMKKQNNKSKSKSRRVNIII
jgi:hypothetical protein